MMHGRVLVLLVAGGVLAGTSSASPQGTAQPPVVVNSAPIQVAIAPIPTTWPAPVSPHATPEARALLKVIDSVSGHGTLTRQHNFPNDVSRWTDRAYVRWP
jgi:hypothetical protein